MKYRNKSDQDLIVMGKLVAAGAEADFDRPIEGNSNFEFVPEPAAAPVVPAAAPPVAAPITPAPTQGGVSQ